MHPASYSKSEVDINNFKKGKRINSGGFGFVYQVEDKKTGKLYAAKVIDCRDSEELCEKMIDREVSIMMCAQHPTIIKFVGYSKIDFHDENNVTIIMELAKNGSLYDIIKSIMLNNGPSQYTNTSRQIILAGVSRGMKYLHDRGIIHRDLKAGNILIDENFHPLITDFGMSKFSESGHSKSQSQYGGTISYMAPEILKNEKYDFKVDVYAFGILMFEIICDAFSYPEFEKGEIADLTFRIKVSNENYRPKFVVPVKKSLKNLIEACWSEDPNKRPNFGEIYNKLSNYSEDYFLDDVDIDEFNLYIEDINETIDSTEKLLNQISKLEQENQKLKEKNSKISKKNSELKEEIQSVKNENEKCQTKIKALKEKNQEISKENSELKEEIQSVKSENKKCQTKISALEEENQRLKKENEKYQKELNQTSKSKEEEKSFQLYFLIDDKYKKEFNSSNKVNNIIEYISSITHTKLHDIRVFDNEKNCLLDSNSFLYSIFKKNDQNHAYKLRSEKAVDISFQNINGKFFNQSMWPSIKISEVLEALKAQGKKIEDGSFIIFYGRVLDMESTLLSVIGNNNDDDNDDDNSLFIIETEMPQQYNVQLMSTTKNYGIFKFIEGASGDDVHFWASKLTGQDYNSISLIYKKDVFNDDELINSDHLFYIRINDSLEKDKNSSTEDLYEYEEENDESSINKWHDVIVPSKDDMYIFKFKIIQGECIDIQLHKDVTVKDVKEIFAEKEEVEPCSVTIYLGNNKLHDNIRLTSIQIPEKIPYFSVRIYDLNKELKRRIRVLHK